MSFSAYPGCGPSVAGRFIAVGCNGMVLSSVNGEAWKFHSGLEDITFFDAAYAEGRSWIFGDRGAILISEASLRLFTGWGWTPEAGFKADIELDPGLPAKVEWSSDLWNWQ